MNYKQHIHNELFSVKLDSDELETCVWMHGEKNRKLAAETITWPIDMFFDLKKQGLSPRLGVVWQGWRLDRYIALWLIVLVYSWRKRRAKNKAY